MDINLLVLNVGNSRLAVGVFLAGELAHSIRIAHENREDWAGKIADAWKRIEGEENAAVAGASVNPLLNEELEHVVERVTKRPLNWVGRQIDLPIKVLTEKPEETGVDRVVNIAAAHEQMEKACVVVDAGTAITVDCCNDAGEFLGGAIAPGLSIMLEALHEKTTALPRVPFSPETLGAVTAEPFGR